MIKTTLTAAALLATVAVPALAQTPNSAQPSTTPGMTTTAPTQSTATDKKAGFVTSQAATEWRSSKLVGASVYGPDNASIGEINDVIIDGQGNVKAAIVGVGGFLGVGEKNVALPFEALNVTRKQGSSSIDKITVSFSKDELKSAPQFAFYQDPASTATTGSSSTTGGAGSMPRAGGAAGGGMAPPANR